MRKGDAREAALLEATEELLHRIAPAELTVEAIARRAQLTRTAFYFYFASKEEAIGRLAERYLGEIFEAAQPAFDPDIPLRDGARTAITWRQITASLLTQTRRGQGRGLIGLRGHGRVGKPLGFELAQG